MTSLGEAPEERRLGRLRRAAGGAWHVPAGVFFVLRHPRLWPFAAAPAAVTLLCLLGGLVAGAFAASWAEKSFGGPESSLPDLLSLTLDIGVWIAIVAAAVGLGLAIALILTAPLLELIGRRAERIARGITVDQSKGFWWEARESVKGALRLLLVAPVILVVGLIPLVGPPLAALWSAYVLSIQQTEAPLTRRGLGSRERRAWHKEWRAENMGFGLAGVVTLLVPFANLLLGPALAVGATLLVLEIEGAPGTASG